MPRVKSAAPVVVEEPVKTRGRPKKVDATAKDATVKAEKSTSPATKGGNGATRIKKREVLEAVKKLGEEDVKLSKVIALFEKKGATPSSVINHIYSSWRQDPPLLVNNKLEDGTEFVSLTKAGMEFLETE